MAITIIKEQRKMRCWQCRSLLAFDNDEDVTIVEDKKYYQKYITCPKCSAKIIIDEVD